MLVLALQFSRCESVTHTHVELEGELDGAAPAASNEEAAERSDVRLLQNGREDRPVGAHERGRRTYDLDELVDEPTSAPTRCPGTEWSFDHRRCGMDSLERR